MEHNASDYGVLGARLYTLPRGELAALGEALCAQLERFGGYHGGVRPGNIRYAGEDAVALGAPARAGSRDWGTEELEFMAPEVFWSGELAATADVYSVGLLLYAGVNGGRLPFYPQGREPTPNDRAAALRLRMNNEPLQMPRGAGRALAEIIRRATQYRPEDRYQTPAALGEALRAYRAERRAAAPSAQEMFDKPEQELTDVERMMLGILSANAGDEPEPAEAPSVEPSASAPEPAAEAPAEPAAEIPQTPAEEAAPETPPAEATAETPAAAAPEISAEAPAPEPVLSPAAEDWSGKTVHAETKKRGNKGGVIAALAICAAVLVVLILKSLGVFGGGTAAPETTATPEPTPTVATTPTPTATPEPTPTPTPTPVASTYELVVSDASWTAAEADAEAKGGHLVVIDDAEELAEVTALADAQGVRYVWIGLSRTASGELAWVNGAESGYYDWADGEPSVRDTSGAAEDYVLLSSQSGVWRYNDCIGDPAASYPGFYSGRMAYVIEYGN